MKPVISLYLFTTVILLSNYAYAGEKRVELKVAQMTCASCPYIVQKSLERVKGVSKVEVSFEEKRAVVIFDSLVTNKEALIEATSNAGFPSKVVNKKE